MIVITNQMQVLKLCHCVRASSYSAFANFAILLLSISNNLQKTENLQSTTVQLEMKRCRSMRSREIYNFC